MELLYISIIVMGIPATAAIAIVVNSYLKERAKLKPFFKNKNGRFQHFDIVYDRGSTIRPDWPGILKHDPEEGWFILWDDTLETLITDFRNIEMYEWPDKI